MWRQQNVYPDRQLIDKISNTQFATNDTDIKLSCIIWDTFCPVWTMHGSAFSLRMFLFYKQLQRSCTSQKVDNGLAMKWDFFCSRLDGDAGLSNKKGLSSAESPGYYRICLPVDCPLAMAVAFQRKVWKLNVPAA